jgi:Family of unknown function (DUF5691)
MEFWNNIVLTAMLGTGKKQVQPAELNSQLAEVLAVITESSSDKEEQFLQLTAVASNYRQSGTVALHQNDIKTDTAPAEIFPYCSHAASQLLKDILDEENIPLLSLWLVLCMKKQQVVQPLMIPSLLTKAVQQKTLKTPILFCTGKRGAWLSQFNKDWNFGAAATEEELWQTGTTDQRKQVLQNLRATDPAKAREWLQQTWKQESAGNKAEFIKIISPTAAEEDVEWLESILADKSQKVKDETLQVLKRIPSSKIIQQYWQIMEQAISITTEKTMLGLSSKKVVHIKLPDVIDEAIFKSGIEKISSQKNITDEAFILYQLMCFIPPNFWDAHLKETPENIIVLLRKSDQGKALIPAIGLAAGRFKNTTWATHFLHEKSKFYPDLLPLLLNEEREKYLLEHFDKVPEMAINFLTNATEEWSVPLTKKILQHTIKNIYQYNRSFYNRNIHLFPVAITNALDAFVPTEEYHKSTWDNMKDHITKLVSLKQQTIHTFQ